MQNVIVTGGGRGLWRARGRTLAAAGYRVIAVARGSTEELEAASRAAADGGRGAIEFRACDLSDFGQIAPLVKALRADFGPLYGLVNNAGLGTSGLLSTMRDQDIQRLVQLNTISPMILSKYVVRSMMAQRNGRIINIASIVASTGYAGLSVYSATKASLIGFTKSLAREVGKLGITVNAIAPGFIDTDMTRGLEEPDRKRVIARSTLHRLAEPEDIAAMSAFLMGEGGRNITGAVMTVDAGSTA